MMVNPSGVQLDMLNSVAGGEDQSPDWVWDSAGRLNDTGYAVEMRLPLAEHPVQRRRRRAHGHAVLAPRQPHSACRCRGRRSSRASGCSSGTRRCVFSDLQPRLPREVIPAATYCAQRSRATRRAAGARPTTTADVGLSAKIGLTSTITLDATVNPDFSQVESDAFQVEVNQRFPVFFSEKRPFFMEGAGIFTLAGAGQATTACSAPSTRAASSIRSSARS